MLVSILCVCVLFVIYGDLFLHKGQVPFILATSCKSNENIWRQKVRFNFLKYAVLHYIDFSRFSVTLLSEKNFDTYHVRVLRLKKLGVWCLVVFCGLQEYSVVVRWLCLCLQEEGHQNIVHLQFTEWPGHGVPKVRL